MNTNTKVITNFPLAEWSPDYYKPNGAHYDNNSSPELLIEFEALYPQFKLLDLGCAGGQFVIDAVNRGHYAIGLDGCDHPLNEMTAAGYANWTTYHEKILFNVDIVEKFEIFHHDQPVKFDIITMWEVIEHLRPHHLEKLFINIHKHLKDDGIFVLTVNILSHQKDGEEYHQTICPRLIWEKYILDKFFHVFPYDFYHCPRMDAVGNIQTPGDSIPYVCKKKNGIIY